MASVLKVIFWLFSVLYGIALFLFAVGAFGWFGQEKDPLAAVFLMPLGLPWNLMLDGAAESFRLWLGALAPLVNLVVIGGLVRLLNQKRHRT